MICALNWDRRQRLPDDRMELYRLALEMLLETRDDERAVRSELLHLNRVAKEELLGAIAYWMLRNGYSEAGWGDVESELKTPLQRMTQISASASDVLRNCLKGAAYFASLSTMSCNSSIGLFWNIWLQRLPWSLATLDFWSTKLREESWREAIVFAAGHAQGPSRDRLIKELLKKRFFRLNKTEIKVTAACCLETVSRSLAPDLLAALQSTAKELFPPRDLPTARLLAPAASGSIRSWLVIRIWARKLSPHV